MAETSKREVYRHDMSANAGGTYLLGNYSKYYEVTVTVEATTLNSNDSSVQIVERTDPTLSWNPIAGMAYIFTAPPTGSQDFIFGDWGSEEIGITINNGSCTAGILSVWVDAKEE
jgi:hypothetical protein